MDTLLAEGSYRRLRSRFVRPVVPVEKMVTYLFPRFGPGASSPQQRACEIYLRSGSRSEVADFLLGEIAAFRPKSLAETLFGENASTLAPLTDMPPLTRFEPWAKKVRRFTGYLGQGEDTFGPLSEEKLEKEVDRLTHAVESLSSKRYRPDEHDDGYLTGILVLRGSDYRLLVQSGMHRLAAMAALGFSSVAVRKSLRTTVIDCSAAGTWPQVRSGACPESIALKIVDRFFATDLPMTR